MASGSSTTTAGPSSTSRSVSHCNFQLSFSTARRGWSMDLRGRTYGQWRHGCTRRRPGPRSLNHGSRSVEDEPAHQASHVESQFFTKLALDSVANPGTRMSNTTVSNPPFLQPRPLAAVNIGGAIAAVGEKASAQGISLWTYIGPRDPDCKPAGRRSRKRSLASPAGCSSYYRKMCAARAPHIRLGIPH